MVLLSEVKIFFLGGGIIRVIRHAWLLRRVLGTLHVAASEKADCMNIIGFVVSSIHFSIPSFVSESK